MTTTASEGGGGGASRRDCLAIAAALEKWSKRCEMRGTIEAAVSLTGKMMSVDVESLDRDPWILNTQSGIVDLRTGRQSPHDPSQYLTRITGAEYHPELTRLAVAEGMALWERVVRDVVPQPGIAAFLQRWFGYCATGATREQVFVVHWGDGANGKSTILDTVARALGDYASTASSSLIANASNENKGNAATPEIAALRGRRMVTAHETREGVALREDFVKVATGGDRLTARHLYGDPFEFVATHKLQLLTNAKPVVKGQDHGIWRRVRLVPYRVRFGSEEDVRQGKATAVRDAGLGAALGDRAVLAGVLTWIVRGAVAWLGNGPDCDGRVGEGLREPIEVLEASLAYRMEMDRVGQFLTECCEVGADLSVPLTSGFDGLYPTYVEWCKDAGTHALARHRFMHEVNRLVPGVTTKESSVRAEGKKRSVVMVRGLRLLPTS